MARDLLEEAGQQPARRDVLAERGIRFSRPQPAAPLVNTGALVDTLRDVPRYTADALRSFDTGATDLAVGAGQLVSHALPDAMLRPMQRVADYVAGGTGADYGPAADRYSQAMRLREEQYQAGRYSKAPDVARFTGSVVAGMGATSGPAAATLPLRMVQGAKLGFGLGLAAPVSVPMRAEDEQSYWLTKAAQVGTSAVIGALAPAIVEGTIRAAAGLVNKGLNMARGIGYAVSSGDVQTVGNTLRSEMARQGVNFDDLPADAKGKLVAEVQRAIRAGGSVDAEAVRRIADFKRLGIEPTQGQAMRDPLIFAREQNLARTGVGVPLAQRFGQQNEQLIGTLDDVRGGIGATARDPYAAGQNVIAGLRTQDAARRAAVDTAYARARGLAGVEADVPAQPVAQRIGQIMEDFGEDKIPAAVMARVKSFGMLGGQQTRVFNIREAEKLKTLIGNNIDNPQTPTGKALTLLKNSIDDAIYSIGDDAGAQAAGAFREARGLAAQRFDVLDRAPAMRQAVMGEAVAPEKFIESSIIRGSVDDVANTLRELRPQDRAEVRAAILDWIKSRAVSGTEDAARFTQSGYNKALEAIGQRKLEAIFAEAPDVLAQLRALGRVGAYVQAPPVASGVNYSASGTAVLDALQSAGRLPMVGLPIQVLTGKPADMMRAYQVSQSLNAVPARQPAGLLSSELIDRTAAQSGLIGVPVAIQLPQQVEPRRRGLLSSR